MHQVCLIHIVTNCQLWQETNACLLAGNGNQSAAGKVTVATVLATRKHSAAKEAGCDNDINIKTHMSREQWPLPQKTAPGCTCWEFYDLFIQVKIQKQSQIH